MAVCGSRAPPHELLDFDSIFDDKFSIRETAEERLDLKCRELQETHEG
jgi:hypothetical protein